MRPRFGTGWQISPSMLHVLGFGALLLSGLLFIVCVHRPLQAKQTAHRHRIGQLNRLIEIALKAESKRADIQNDLADLLERANSVRERIPDSPNEAELLERLSTIAGEANLVVSDYRRGAMQREGAYTRFEIGLKGAGSFESICRFLDDLNRFSRVTRIDQMKISSGQETGIYPVNLTIAVYFGSA